VALPTDLAFASGEHLRQHGARQAMQRADLPIEQHVEFGILDLVHGLARRRAGEVHHQHVHMAGFDDQRLTGAWLSQVADIGNHLPALLAEQGDDVGTHELACIRHHDAFALEPSGHGFLLLN